MSQRYRQLLFLCTGNYYRSRFAELLFNAVAGTLCPDWRATSRGIALEFGVNNVGPISSHTLEGLHQRGILVEGPLSFPRQLQAAELERADHIIAVDETEHRPLLARRFPSCREDVEFWQVSDIPYTPVAQALATMEQNVWSLIPRLSRRREC